LDTGEAPPFRAPLADPFPPVPDPVGSLAAGERLGDFELLRLLGKGAFARVFLARQVSLDRPVALKISANAGSEAQTLASLEHDHIVRVFSETVHAERDLRVLCMQYVPGTTLAHVITALVRRGGATGSGEAILEAIDELSTAHVALDPAALRERQELSGSDFIEAVCWIGARLAEALAYAHKEGVLHRDIKPANILLTRYGRPLLADFNLASDARPHPGPTDQVVGGTFAYMSPEQADALNPDLRIAAGLIDQRSDIYSLGLVLFELLTGRLPYEPPSRARLGPDLLSALAAARRQGAPSARTLNPDVPEPLDRTLRRCLEPEPEERYQQAAELARALEGCRALRQAEKHLPVAGPLTRAALRRPFLVGLTLMLLPHLIGSVVNICYNAIQIIGRLTPDQQATFTQLTLGYNLVVYPICVWASFHLLVPVFRTWRELHQFGRASAARVSTVRRRVLTLPSLAAGLSCLGWLPCGLFFPLGLAVVSGPVSAEVFGHFAVSCTISGLIALTYSVLAAKFLVLRILYPNLWVDARDLGDSAAELQGQTRALWACQLFAGLIPLAGAVLMVGVGPEQVASYRTYRLLVTALIALGMAGFGIALTVSARLGQTLNALAGYGIPNSPRRLSARTSSARP
jgi:serine/threonine protein kinase